MKEKTKGSLLEVGLIILNCFIYCWVGWGIINYFQTPQDAPGQEIMPRADSYYLIENNSLRAISSPITYSGTKLIRIVTGYSSTPDQTDDTPFLTAYNTKVRKGIVASNEFSKGTKLMIDGYIYTVEDKTHPRYQYLIDIWFPTREEAKNWGRQIKEVILLN